MINDYAELVTEVAHRTGATDVASRAKMYVGMAEEYMRKALRIGSVDLVPAFEGLEAADTNWLLQESPETYLQAVQYQVFQSLNDVERGAPMKALLDQSLDRLLHDAKLAVVKGAKIAAPGGQHGR